MNHSSVAESPTDNWKNLSYCRLASYLFRSDAMHGDVRGVEVCFWIDRNRKRFKNRPGAEMH